MAKKYEFKPDKPRSGLLSKLFLTQKQRRSLLKWSLYTLVLLMLSVIQDVLLCRLSFFGSTTELVPCGIFLICLLEGAQTGSVFCLVASCLYRFSGSTSGNYVIVFLTVLGVMATFLRQSYLQKGFGAAMLCTFCAMTVYEMAMFGIGVFLGHTYLGRWSVFLLTALLTMVVAPALYPLLHGICKLGGESWKE